MNSTQYHYNQVRRCPEIPTTGSSSVQAVHFQSRECEAGVAETAACVEHAGGGAQDAHFLTVNSPKKKLNALF